MVWTPDNTEELRRLWAQGLSITQIGKALGLSRNAVVGKAHRLNLDSRASPIIRSAPVAPPYKGPRCKWPVGDPKTVNFGFCGDPSLEGKPYCEKHCAVAYTTWGENAQVQKGRAA